MSAEYPDLTSSFLHHELLDRTYILMEMFDLVRNHVSVESLGVEKEVEAVEGALNVLYQTIGSKR